MKTLKIHLIRHGTTDANALGQYIGSRTDSPLSPEGLDELRLLKENMDYPEIDCLYSSPMLRCRQTGAVLYPDFGITSVENLKEYDFGAFEGKTAAQLEADQSFLNWASGKCAPPEGEDNTEFITRLCVGLRQIVMDMLEKGKSEAAVIMHGGAIMMLLGACGLPRHRSVEWTANPGRGYTLLITPSLYHKSGVVEVVDIV